MNAFRNSLGKQSGASMVEVLVTLVILLVGLLGLAGLQLQAQRSEVESYQRVHALILLQDMVGRINTNRANAALYVANVGTGDTQPAATSCAGQSTLATRDLCDWSNALKGASEQSGTQAVGTLVGGRGCITYSGYTAVVSVAWQGLADTAAPPPSLTCGQNQYGGSSGEKKRRVISLPVTLGCLTC